MTSLTEQEAADKVHAALRAVQEKHDLRGSQMVRATLAALLLIAPKVAHIETTEESR